VHQCEFVKQLFERLCYLELAGQSREERLMALASQAEIVGERRNPYLDEALLPVKPMHEGFASELDRVAAIPVVGRELVEAAGRLACAAAFASSQICSASLFPSSTSLLLPLGNGL
jgi:hypothetical protein